VVRIPRYCRCTWPQAGKKEAKEPWIIVGDQATDAETLYEYGRRFTIEEGFLDHKSGGFQWESSNCAGS
jgi:hypothetical protein